MSRASLLVAVAIMVVQSVLAIVAPIDASANGRGFNRGYFFNADAAGLSHYNVLEGGLPRSQIGTDKQKFLDYIYGTLLNTSPNGGCPGNGCDYVGAAYIIQTMRGGSGGWDFGYPSAADVGDWAEKVRNPNIGLRWANEGGLSGGVTTARFRSGNRDVARTSGTTSGQTLTFYNISTGQTYYMIRESCANPLGDFPGLPNLSWDVTPSASANKTTVRPGQTITWTHGLKNNGPSPTWSNVSYRYKNSGHLGTGSGADNAMPAYTASGGTRSFTSTYTANAGDADKDLCRATSANPRSSSNGGTLTSAAACVKVVNEWTITPTSAVTSITGTVSKTTAKPGDTITWKHEVKNGGPDATRKAVIYRYENSSGLTAGSGAAQTLAIDTVNGGVKSVASTYSVTSSDVGKTLCRATSATPRSWNNATKLTSTAACVNVPYNYNLTPTISLDRVVSIEAPASVTATPRVTNSGPTQSLPAQWQLTRIDVTPSNNIPRPTGGPSSVSVPPCSFFVGTGATCRIINRGNSTFRTSGSPTGDALNAALEQISDLPVGSKICFALSVQAVSATSSNWAHSAPACLAVSKKPKVQVLGGDLIVGRATPYNPARTSKVATSTSSAISGATSLYYGSWSEYAIIPSGLVSGMSSGAMFSGGSTTNPANLCSLSILTIANNAGSACGPATPIGGYRYSSTAPSVASRFTVTGAIASATTNLTSLANKQVFSYAGANLEIKNSSAGAINMAKDRWVVINAPNTTVTIRSDINYTSASLASINEIPQVVIIAKNIIVADSVTNIDAWLISVGSGADGVVNTCGAGAGITTTTLPHAGQCGTKLTVNGPVIANHLVLRRTAGALPGTKKGDPAEVFNLRADAYLWATAYSSGSERVFTVSTKELPPRF